MTTQTLDTVKRMIHDNHAKETKNKETTIRDIEHKINKHKKRIEETERVRNKLLGIETDMRTRTLNQISELQQEIHRLEKLKFSLQYPQMDTSPLTWRNEKGFPVFALFTLRDPLCFFQGIDGGTRGSSHVNVTKLGNFYGDVYQKLRNLSGESDKIATRVGMGVFVFSMLCTFFISFLLNQNNNHGPMIALGTGLSLFLMLVFYGIARANKENTFTLSAQFKGGIPESTREKIANAQKDFGSDQYGNPNIFILAEAPWELQKTVTIPSDPLVLGYKYDTFWLIDEFDTTKVEEYVRQEFTT